MTNTRTETDTFGPIDVPADRYWGAQTQRSLQNFQDRLPTACLCLSCARWASSSRPQPDTNMALGLLDKEIGGEDPLPPPAKLRKAKHDDHFPLVVWQTGSGTQSQHEMPTR